MKQKFNPEDIKAPELNKEYPAKAERLEWRFRKKAKHVTRIDKQQAKAAGIPQHLMQYAKRYGIGIDELISTQRKFSPPKGVRKAELFAPYEPRVPDTTLPMLGVAVPQEPATIEGLVIHTNFGEQVTES